MSKKLTMTHGQYERKIVNKIVECSMKVELVSTFCRALYDLIDDLINDSVSYCACVVTNFSDDRHKNRLVEICLHYQETVITPATGFMWILYHSMARGNS